MGELFNNPHEWTGLVSDRPGLGIDVDETLAARFPIEDDPPFDLQWGNLRRRDGSPVKP